MRNLENNFNREIHEMTRKISAQWILAAMLGLVANAALANDSRPFAKVEPLALGEARWTDGFFADRFEMCRTQMIPGMTRLMEGTNYSQFYFNFEILEMLKQKDDDKPQELEKELNSLEEMIVEELQPFENRGYNKKKK